MRRTVPIWVYPTILLAVGFVCGIAASRIEVGADSPLSRITYGGDAEAARSLLSNVLGGIISITTLTLTITIVTIQLASSQYSPRLMKRYLRDRNIQLTVGFFFFVFAFTIPVLFHVRSGEDELARFVPNLALSIVIVLAVLMLVGLVYFVFHVTRSVRVENILEEIATAAIRVLEDDPRLGESDEPPPVEDRARAVLAARSGFLTRVDVETLEERLGSDDRIWFDRGVGDYVIERSPVAWYAGNGDPADVARWVDGAIELHSERDEDREFAFGLRQVLDIGVKALSPGINDPTTAIVSLSVATRTLASAAAATSVSQARPDDYGRVVIPRPSWSELVFSTFDQFATYGCGDVQVARSIVRSVKCMVALAPSDASTERLSDTLDSIAGHLHNASLAQSESETISAELDDCRRLLDDHPTYRIEKFRTAQRII